MYICIYICIYTYTCTCTYTYRCSSTIGFVYGASSVTFNLKSKNKRALHVTYREGHELW